MVQSRHRPEAQPHHGAEEEPEDEEEAHRSNAFRTWSYVMGRAFWTARQRQSGQKSLRSTPALGSLGLIRTWISLPSRRNRATVSCPLIFRPHGSETSRLVLTVVR